MNYSKEKDEIEEKMQAESRILKEVTVEIAKKIVGQEYVGQRLLMAIIAQGHVLLEGLPGLAKTTFIKALSNVADLSFSRIQFTPDLLPADVIGTQIYDPKTSDFKVKKGPIFAHLVLADEINRAPAKVQAALLEAMEEKQVTIGDESFELDEPFMVLATQNPVEQEGTYPLPEAQVDRFLFKVKVGYSTPEEEQEIIRRASSREIISLSKKVTRQDLRRMRELVDHVYVSDKIRKYIVDLVFASRFPAEKGLKELSNYIEYGASPRASIFLDRVARINAMMEGRSFVAPQDVKDVGMDILRHRIRPTYEAEAEGITSENIISSIFERVDVP